MRTISEMKAQITDKVATDDAFRAELLSDPKATVERELQMSVPDGVSINVLEDSTSAVHLVLPPAPEQLDLDQLRQVSGGSLSW